MEIMAWVFVVCQWLARRALRFRFRADLRIDLDGKEGLVKEKMLTTGEAATALGVHPWKVSRVYDRGLLPEPERLGQFRMIAVGDLPKLKTVLMKIGYLKA